MSKCLCPKCEKQFSAKGQMCDKAALHRQSVEPADKSSSNHKPTNFTPSGLKQ